MSGAAREAACEEAIVLAGGFGTRLRSVVSDVPKPLAPIAGRPFLEYLLAKLERDGVRRVILSTGYKSELIEAHFGARWRGLDLVYQVEETPLGTGGALLAAAGRIQSDDIVLALNGDTLLNEDLSRLTRRCRSQEVRFGLFVRMIEDAARYSTCLVKGGRLKAFEPGVAGKPGFINAGVYALRPEFLTERPLAPPFSFETDFFPEALQREPVCAVETAAPFIDIGVPSSFDLAQDFIPSFTPRES